MYYTSAKNSISDQETASDGTGTGNAASCCSRASSDLKLYQAFIFSVPIFFTFILLFLFYFFYLRRRRVDWSSLRMRSGHSIPISDDISRCELGGLKKELREMLPIIVFNESFSVKDTLCSVCLGEYQGEERLQQIPGCGHTFHMECIDLWLATHTTCPLCRQSLVTSSSSSSSRSSPDENGSEEESNTSSSTTASVHDREPPPETETSSSETNNNGDRDERIGPTVGERDDEVERDIIIIVESVK